MNKRRMQKLLHDACRIIQRVGPDYFDEVSDYLVEQRALGSEITWLQPRLAGYAHGIAWGYQAGMRDTIELFAMGHDNPELRVN